MSYTAIIIEWINLSPETQSLWARWTSIIKSTTVPGTRFYREPSRTSAIMGRPTIYQELVTLGPSLSGVPLKQLLSKQGQ